jgi:hypothetical protein
MTPAEQIQADYAPRLAAAAARDVAAMAEADNRRVGAVLEVPHDVCGIPLRAMTLVDYAALIVSGNAHATPAQEPESDEDRLAFWASHNLAFLWLLSPDYVGGKPKVRDKFISRHAHLPLLEVARGINEYLADTFADAPRKSHDEDDAQPGTSKPLNPIRAGFPIHWQHRIAMNYGWTRAEIRSVPLKELFQHLSLIEAEAAIRNTGRLQPFTGGEYRPLVAEMLQKMNEAAAA